MIGDEILTPEGPGTIVGYKMFKNMWEGYIVLLYSGQIVCWRPK